MTYDSDGRPVGDKELFAIMRGAMKVLSFTADDEANIFKIMACVLHLGNIEFGGMCVLDMCVSLSISVTTSKGSHSV